MADRKADWKRVKENVAKVKETEEQREQETLEFERLQAELEDYGAIMQICIEEAERTMQIWRGTEEMTRQDTEIFMAMMPALSVALFERVTRKTEIGKDDMKVMIREIAFQSFVKFIARYDPHKIDAAIKSRTEDEGAKL